MSRIILEGPDGVGKTTLGLKLSHSLEGLAYYRRRVRHGIRDETLRALTLESAILDRSWPTDMIYSAQMARAPGCSRSDLYRFGLLTARKCALFLILNGGEDEELNHRYSCLRDHWAVPRQSLLQMDAKPSDEEFREILDFYSARMKAMWECPSKGFGSPDPCPIVVIGDYTDLIGDLLFCCGIRPDEVHICDHNAWRFSEADLTDYFKPKIVLDFTKRSVNNENFEIKASEVLGMLRDEGLNRGTPLERINLA